MHDRTTKALLLLIFLALVFNAFVMLVRPSRVAEDGRDCGRYRLYLYEEGWYYRLDTATGTVQPGIPGHSMHAP